MYHSLTKKDPWLVHLTVSSNFGRGGHICGIVHYKECKTVEIVCDIACGLIIGVHVAVYVVICSLKYANQSHHIILKDS